MLRRYSDDPIADAAAFDAECARLEKQVPVCDYCGLPVMEDFYFEINSDAICAECMDRHFRREVVIE